MARLFTTLSITLTIFISCSPERPPVKSTAVVQKKTDTSVVKESKSLGSTGNGSLINGVKIPYKGDNYAYFSRASYTAGRAFLNSKVHKVVRDAYKICETTCPGKKFYIMECSKKKGGKMIGHRTHQNGLSIDFMTPLKKAGKSYDKLDKTGALHYKLEFDKDGKYSKDKSVEIDCETMARHILALHEAGKKNGVRVKKVIWKINLKDELFECPSGKKLKDTGIYFVRYLTPLVDRMHDDHYHIDFEVI